MSDASRWFRERLGRRPWWMNLLMLFCIYMAVIYVPWDLFVKPVAADEEVWFGVRFHGVWAKVLAVPHFVVYAAGAVGFWSMHRFMWPWAAVYVAQVALSFAVWPLLYLDGPSRFVSAVIGGGLFGALAWALHRSKPRFHVRRPSLRERYGEWALVTGASAGIGAAFARALARDGVSCVLTARRGERLRELATELESQHGVATRVVEADLATAGGAAPLLDAVADLEIDVLVNNAGFGYAGRLDLQDPARLDAMVQLNCAAPVALTAGLLPAMRARGRGAIVFTGSVAGLQPLPYHALYAATKSFDNLLGEALWAELIGTGVDVLVIEPGSTVSEFHEVAGELPHAGEPSEDVVDKALRALGHKPSHISGVFNWLRGNAGTRLLPRSAITLVAKGVIAEQTPEELR